MPLSEKLSAVATLAGMQMLVWRMDLATRAFENLNDYSTSVLSKDNFRFFKDSEYMKKLLLPEDLVVVTDTLTKIKERLPTQAIFRIHVNGTLHWFKLTGWPTENYKYYEGTVEEITEHIGQLKDYFDDHNQRLFTLEDTGYPVAIFSRRNNLMVKCNESFRDLLEMTPPLKIKYQLEDLLSSEVKLPLLFEKLLLKGWVKEDLFLVSSKGRKIRATCNFERFSYNTEDLIRIAVVDLSKANLKAPAENRNPAQENQLKNLCDTLKTCSSIDAMLAAIHAGKDLFSNLDVAIFSDIYAKRNKVYAYAHGSLLQDMAPGAQFPYSGTIAENIEKENLEYLIVEDTHASIKAIDWVLFVPNGICSYIAKALYVRGAMRTVLILCSRYTNAFNEGQVKDLTEVATIFHQQLKKIRNM